MMTNCVCSAFVFSTIVVLTICKITCYVLPKTLKLIPAIVIFYWLSLDRCGHLDSVVQVRLISYIANNIIMVIEGSLT